MKRCSKCKCSMSENELIRYCDNRFCSHIESINIVNNDTYAETIGVLADLTNEFILLETIRATAKELIALRPHIRTTKTFNTKLDELEHLVNTD